MTLLLCCYSGKADLLVERLEYKHEQGSQVEMFTQQASSTVRQSSED